MTTPPLTSPAHRGSYTQYTGMGPIGKGKSKPKPGYSKNERRGGFLLSILLETGQFINTLHKTLFPVPRAEKS